VVTQPFDPLRDIQNEDSATAIHRDGLVRRCADGAPRRNREAIWRTFTIGDLRVRQVEYTPGYLADHWCDLGHVLYVLEGELDTELRDGRTFKLLPGMSHQVSNEGDAPHRSSTRTGAKLFIVD
jgi:hypothetical protein